MSNEEIDQKEGKKGHMRLFGERNIKENECGK